MTMIGEHIYYDGSVTAAGVSDPSHENDMTEDHFLQYAGEYIIKDYMVMGNNPPGNYYILESLENGSIYRMNVLEISRPWHFEPIPHWIRERNPDEFSTGDNA